MEERLDQRENPTLEPSDASAQTARSGTRRRDLVLIGLVALAMGMPSLRGGFLSGDDRALIVNHALVSRPSIEHVVKLFTIVHRDLYQPLPMVMMSMEFAIARSLDLFTGSDPDSGAWFFHLNNLLLHAVNAMLVLLLMGRIQRSHGIAVLVGVLFAVHPLQVETVAWLNGRFFLMSTAFALGSLLCVARWAQTRRPSTAAWAVVLAVLCCLCKVNPALPLLMIIVLAVMQAKPRRSGLILLAATLAVVGAFSLLNVWTTEQATLFEGGATKLHGPRSVRVVQALGHYLRTFIWPVGLSSWYPAQRVVAWRELLSVPGLAFALGVVGTAVAVRRWRNARWAILWFLIALAPTLPFFPARNLLAADRYMYLPIVGLIWIVGLAAHDLVQSLCNLKRTHVARTCMRVAAVALVCTLIGMSWYVSSFYRSGLSNANRLATLFPTTRNAWSRVAWAHRERGQHERAIEVAQKQLALDDPEQKAEALQVIGYAQFDLGRTDAAIASLRKAIQLNPHHPMNYHRLGFVFDRTGRIDEAIAAYEKALRIAPEQVPTQTRLARLYTQEERLDEARRLYESALENNAFEVAAIVGLAELDLLEASTEGTVRAAQRLEEMLEWYPTDAIGWTNLGVAYGRLGRMEDALRAYDRALSVDPAATMAALNAAILLQNAGQHAKALDYLKKADDSSQVRASAAYSMAMLGEFTAARSLADNLLALPDPPPTAYVVAAVTELVGSTPARAMAFCEALIEHTRSTPDDGNKLLSAIQAIDESGGKSPWIYLTAGRMLIAQRQWPAAEAFIGLGNDQCGNDPPCLQEAERLRSLLAAQRGEP